jgi:hypothetical protein
MYLPYNDIKVMDENHVQLAALPSFRWRVLHNKNAQQSVHWTLGILRGLQAFFWLRVFPAPKQSPRPPTRG